MGDCKINGVTGYRPSFGYKTVLSNLYKKGKLPTVKYGLYGNRLDIKNCSNEHLLPASLGGTTDLSNIALADRFINTLRGNRDIRLFLTPEMAKAYLSQFVDVVVKYSGGKFIGNKYIQGVIETLRKLGVELK